MKIISWNCNRKFREKYKKVLKYDADIYVIPEAERPKKYADDPTCKEYIDFCSNGFWIGEYKDGKLNEDKGLFIFAKKNIKLENNSWNSKHELFLSVRVNDSFNLVGVWPQGNVPQYVKHLEGYLDDCKEEFEKSDYLVMCGDFNINPRVQGQEKKDSFYNILNFSGYESLYHKTYDEKLGEESIPTHYFQFNKNKPFHIDYVFATSGLVKNLKIGTYEEYVGCEDRKSDHVPLIFEVDL